MTPIPAETERALIQRVKAGDDAAFDALLRQYRPLILRYARRYSNGFHTFEDLWGVYAVALWEAAKAYREDRGTRFITHAHNKIMRAFTLRDALDCGPIHIPESAARLLIGTNPIKTERHEEAVARAHAAQCVLSLDVPLSEDGPPIAETLQDPCDPYDALWRRAEEAEAMEAAAEAFDALPPRRRAVLSMLASGRTYQEAAEEMGYSCSRVIQVRRQAIESIHRHLRDLEGLVK